MMLGFILAALVSFFGITRPLGRLVAVLRRMARGEITAEIPETRRGGEIGTVGQAVAGIKAMVAEKAAEEVEMRRRAAASAAEQLGASIGEIGRRVAGSSELAGRAVDEADRTAARMGALSGVRRRSTTLSG